MAQTSTVILVPFSHFSELATNKTFPHVYIEPSIFLPNSPHSHHLHAQKHEGTVDVKTWQENSETGSEMNFIFSQIWEKSDFIIFSHFLWVLLPMACDAWAWIRDGHAPIFTVRYCPPFMYCIYWDWVSSPLLPPSLGQNPNFNQRLVLMAPLMCKYLQICAFSISFRISRNCMAIPSMNTE